MHRFPQGASLNSLFIQFTPDLIIISTGLHWIYQNSRQPIISVETTIRIRFQRYTIHTFKSILVKSMYMAVMRNMLIQYGHLTTTDTRTNITHTIIVTDLFMLVMRERFTSLRSIKHRLLLGAFIRNDQSPATRSSDHLITIKRQHAKGTESTAFLSLKLRTQSLCSILQHWNIIFSGYRANLINPGRHTVKMNRKNSFRFLTRLCDSVLNGFFQ